MACSSNDPDVEPWDKTGIHYAWSCTQLHTSFVLDGIDWDRIDDRMKKVLHYPSGCFGVPPGGRANVT